MSAGYSGAAPRIPVRNTFHTNRRRDRSWRRRAPREWQPGHPPHRRCCRETRGCREICRRRRSTPRSISRRSADHGNRRPRIGRCRGCPSTKRRAAAAAARTRRDSRRATESPDSRAPPRWQPGFPALCPLQNADSTRSGSRCVREWRPRDPGDDRDCRNRRVRWGRAAVPAIPPASCGRRAARGWCQPFRSNGCREEREPGTA